MGRFLLRRFVLALTTIVVVSSAVFIMARLAGDPRALLIDPEAPRAQWEELGRELGLDKPLYQQYWIFIKGVLRGDLGQSFLRRQPVGRVILDRIPATAELALAAFIFSLVMGVPLGILAAVHRGGILDQAGRVLALIGQSVPPFWLGIVLILLFAVQVEWLPFAGRSGWTSYVLPAITMGWFLAAANLRLLRSSMLDVLDSEYIRLARGKGVSNRSIIWKHALRNALIPPLTFAGLTLGSLVTGSIVVETVFAWPGLGQLAWLALQGADYPLLQGVVIFFTLVYVVAAFGVDVLYAYIDPRIRYS